jgi:hypothetical protein
MLAAVLLCKSSEEHVTWDDNFRITDGLFNEEEEEEEGEEEGGRGGGGGGE